MTKQWKWQGWVGVLLIAIDYGLTKGEAQGLEWWGYVLSVVVAGLLVMMLVVVPWYCYGQVKGVLGTPTESIIDAERTHATKAAARTRRRLERLERNG